MRKNIIVYLLVIISFVFIITGCSSKDSSVKQSAAAKVTVGEEQTALMKVDLTDGYSVEFATGAAYFYKGDSIDDSNVIAHAFVINKNEYDEEISYYKGKDDLEGEFKDLEDGVYSYKTKENAEYYFPSNNDFYWKVVVQKELLEEADSIYTRFSASSIEE